MSTHNMELAPAGKFLAALLSNQCAAGKNPANCPCRRLRGIAAKMEGGADSLVGLLAPLTVKDYIDQHNRCEDKKEK